MLEGIRNNSQSIWVKIAFGLIILVFVFWGIGSVQNTSTIVAKINGEDVTEQALLQAYSQQREAIRTNIPSITDEQLEEMNFMQIVFEGLVLKTLLEQESRRTGISITPLELYDVISLLPFTHDANGKFNQEVYEQALKNMGQSPKQFEDAVKSDMLEDKFKALLENFAYASPIQAKQVFDFQLEQRAFDAYLVNDEDFLALANPTEEELINLYESTKNLYALPARIDLDFIEVSPLILANPDLLTDEEILAEYNANKDLYDTPEEATASHILVLLDENASAEEEEGALNKIKEVQDKLAQGEDFKELARLYSDDRASAEIGGELGTFTRGQMVKAFEDAAFSQEINVVSEPVRSRFGYHLILVEDRKEKQELQQEKLREVVGAVLAEKDAASKVQTVIDSLMVQVLAGTSLEDAAQKEGLELTSTDLVSFDVLASTYNLTQSDIDLLKEAQIGTVLENPLSTGNSLIIAQVKQNQPETVREFEGVRNLVLEEAKKDKAHEMAKAKSEEILADIETNPPTELESATMARNGFSSLINSETLSQDLFAAEPFSAWLKNAYEFDEGYLLAFPKEVIEVSDDMWQAQESTLLTNMEQSRKDMFYSIFLQELRADAKIEIINELYFQ